MHGKNTLPFTLWSWNSCICKRIAKIMISVQLVCTVNSEKTSALKNINWFTKHLCLNRFPVRPMSLCSICSIESLRSKNVQICFSYILVNLHCFVIFCRPFAETCTFYFRVRMELPIQACSSIWHVKNFFFKYRVVCKMF